MPQRFLKPGLKDSMRFNSCSWPAQSLFVRLITVVDDYGRYDAHPLALARILFPFGRPAGGQRIAEKDVVTWLAELAKARLVLLYKVAGEQYLQLTRWTERIRAKNTRFPAPPDNIRQQLLAEDNKSAQMLSDVAPVTANAAPSTSTPTSASTSASTGEREKGAPRVFSEGEMKASRNQWKRLDRFVAKYVTTNLEGDGKQLLEKKRAMLKALTEKQDAGDWSTIDPKEFGL